MYNEAPRIVQSLEERRIRLRMFAIREHECKSVSENAVVKCLWWNWFKSWRHALLEEGRRTILSFMRHSGWLTFTTDHAIKFAIAIPQVPESERGWWRFQEPIGSMHEATTMLIMLPTAIVYGPRSQKNILSCKTFSTNSFFTPDIVNATFRVSNSDRVLYKVLNVCLF